MSDQHQADCLGCGGHPQVRTPNLDRLAAEGIMCTNACAQSPICTPSRVSLLSGQYPHNHGYFWINGPTPASMASFLSHFRASGYRTAAIGKLHVPNEPVDWLLDHVDLHAEVYEYGNFGARSPYFAYLRDRGLMDAEDSFQFPELPSDAPGLQPDEARPSKLPLEHSVEAWIAREALGFMQNTGGAPFCLQVSFPRPHACYTPDLRFWNQYDPLLDLPDTFDAPCDHRPPHFQKMKQQYERHVGHFEPKGRVEAARRIWRGYLACITQVDWAMGLLLDYLDKTGLADNTVVVYVSDHGAYTGVYGLLEKIPGICSDQVCRVPMIWRVPEVTDAGGRLDGITELVDVAPTLASLCGLRRMNEADGVDLSAMLGGGAAPNRPGLTEGPMARALRFDNYRFVHYPAEMFGEQGEEQGELYDLADDPMEMRNLYHEPAYQDVVTRARRLMLDRLLATTRVTNIWPSPQGPSLRDPNRPRDWPANLNYL